jgi:hypothetical protein
MILTDKTREIVERNPQSTSRIINTKFFEILRDRRHDLPLLILSRKYNKCEEIKQIKGNRLHQDIISKKLRYDNRNQSNSVIALRAIMSLRLTSIQVLRPFMV